ncbi:MAG: alpha-galactosidase [Clostridia bacterium]|nr:alpha-galactosidase [Clostridia bacterium]
MKAFDLSAFQARVLCEEENADAALETALHGSALTLFLTAQRSRPKFIELTWQTETDGRALVLGDAWERSYGDLEFLPVRNNDRWMPWYFIVDEGNAQVCFGVKTQPNAFVSFRCGESSVTALVDCRNGGCGVRLNGRRLQLATFVFKAYDSTDAFACLCDYCKTLCDMPLLPDRMICGGNNWYYAYGSSDYETIVRDAALQAKLADGLTNRPFMVIDDGWQVHSCEGPWVPNKKFRDMKALADDVKRLGAEPGLWVRLLHNRDKALTADVRLERGGERRYLDPTHPRVQQSLRNDIARIRSWGYRLLKHDFSTVDLFGSYGMDLTAAITNDDSDWHFFDRSKTNAEIVLDLYRLILDACGDMLVLGCNTVSHLCAGLAHLNRTGDDTSGREWDRTRVMGVNTLAFRLAQNNAFYLVDADCVGILKDCIPWEKNRQWLDLLARSGTALFVSCDKADDEKVRDLAAAFRLAQQPHALRPVDWKTTRTPQHWQDGDAELRYEW